MKEASQKGFKNNALVDASGTCELEFINHFADQAAARMIRPYVWKVIKHAHLLILPRAADKYFQSYVLMTSVKLVTTGFRAW